MIGEGAGIRKTIIDKNKRHLRTTVSLADGTDLIFHEAAIANIVRAYISLKTHPTKSRVLLRGGAVAERKEGFAEWQLLEE